MLSLNGKQTFSFGDGAIDQLHCLIKRCLQKAKGHEPVGRKKSQSAQKIGLQPPYVLCWLHVFPLQVAGVTAVVREWHRAKNPWCGKTWFQNISGTYSAQRRVDGHLSTSVRWSLWHGQGLNSLQQRRKKHVKMQNFWGLPSTTRRFLPFE